MALTEVDGVPIWYEEHGDPGGPPLVALHGGILNFETTFGHLLPWLARGRRVIGIELQGHGHTPDTGRTMSIERFADDVGGVLDHLGIERADVFGYSLGALVATSVAVRHPGRVRRLVLASGHLRPSGYYDEITAPESTSPKLPTEDDFVQMQQAYEAVAPDPTHFFPFLERMQPVVHDFTGWTDDEIRSVTAPTLLIAGDDDFVRLDHLLDELDLFPDSQLAVLPATKHMEVIRRPEQLQAIVEPFLR